MVPDALPLHVSAALVGGLADLGRDSFHEATIGRGQDSTRNPFVRRNKISWIADDDATLGPWHEWIDALRTYLNRTLYLGLYSFESHYMRYDAGDRYKRHFDAFRGERNRIVSLVTYLNEGWQPDQGGELLLYVEGEEPVRVTPAFGTVVLFLSEEMPHEVLPTARTRFGVAGWFRLNASINNQIDPPR